MVLAMLLLLGAMPAHAAFSDVPASYTYSNSVDYVQREGIVTGYADGTYKPESSINRAEFTKIVVNSFYKNEVDDAYICNQEYKTDISMCEGINKCEAAAFVNYGACMGYSTDANGKPDPKSSILKVYDSCFPDITNGVWYQRFVCLAKMKSLIGGYPDGSFKPEQNVSFVEASKILSNAFGFSTSQDAVWYRPYVGALADRKAIPSTISLFEQKITRGELAEIIYRLKEQVVNRDSKAYSSLK